MKPKKKKIIVEEEKEDWSIFGIIDEDISQEQIVQILQELTVDTSSLNSNAVAEIASFKNPP